MTRTIATIAAFDADLIGLQELVRNHAAFRCDDQPALIASGLSRITGRRWQYHYEQEWVTPNRQCAESGRGDGVETEGLAVFTPEPSLDVEYVPLWATRIGLSARIASAPDVPVIVTHLASGANGRRDRTRQLDALLPWAASRSPARILMGDLNAAAGAPELAPVFDAYADAWTYGRARLAARGDRLGSTRPRRNARIDYVLFTPGGRLRLTRVEAVNSARLLDPWESSDHRPVVATFEVSPR